MGSYNKMFRHVDGSHLNACVSKNGGPYDRFDFADGFYHTALNTIQSLEDAKGTVALEDGQCLYLDDAIYPICFNYRQYIELTLKYIHDIEASKSTPPSRASNNHKLNPLFCRIEKLDKARKDYLNTAIDKTEIKTAICDWVQIDPTGTTFRYPDTKPKKVHLEGWSTINLTVLKGNMRKLKLEFDKWSSLLERE